MVVVGINEVRPTGPEEAEAQRWKCRRRGRALGAGSVAEAVRTTSEQRRAARTTSDPDALSLGGVSSTQRGDEEQGRSSRRQIRRRGEDGLRRGEDDVGAEVALDPDASSLGGTPHAGNDEAEDVSSLGGALGDEQGRGWDDAAEQRLGAASPRRRRGKHNDGG